MLFGSIVNTCMHGNRDSIVSRQYSKVHKVFSFPLTTYIHVLQHNTDKIRLATPYPWWYICLLLYRTKKKGGLEMLHMDILLGKV